MQLCRVSPSQWPEAAELTLYSSHTVWENRVVFEAWSKSEVSKAAKAERPKPRGGTSLFHLYH